MTDMLDKCARLIEPIAWRALGCGDTARYAELRASSLRKAASIVRSLMEPTPEMVEAMTLMDVPEGMRRASNFQYRREFRAALRTLLPEETKS